MAEEKNDYLDEKFVNTDDMSVMRFLLHTVKGLSPISVVPVLEMAEAEGGATSEQYEFE